LIGYFRVVALATKPIFDRKSGHLFYQKATLISSGSITSEDSLGDAHSSLDQG
jgi:hypothetical protein